MPISPLCTDQTSVNFHSHGGHAKPLRCKRWSCPTCHELNRARVIAIAREAKPNALLTLTVSSKVYPDPQDAADALKRGLRNLRLRLKRHARLENFEFLAVFEKHKSGHPHLHLLIKGKYLPWKLLRKWWMALTSSHQIDIRKINSHGLAAMYCAKYIGKDLSSFQGCKRWWRSSGYSDGNAEEYQREHFPGQWGRTGVDYNLLRFTASLVGYSVKKWGREGFEFEWRHRDKDPPGINQVLWEATGYNEKIKVGWR